MWRAKRPSVSSTIFRQILLFFYFLYPLASFSLFFSPFYHIHMYTQIPWRSESSDSNLVTEVGLDLSVVLPWHLIGPRVDISVRRHQMQSIAPYHHLSLWATSFLVRKWYISCRCVTRRDLYNESEWVADFWDLCELVMLIISWALNAKNKTKPWRERLCSCLLRIPSELWRRRTQQVKALLITKPDNLSFLPRTHPHGGRKESNPGKLVFTCAWGAGVCMHMQCTNK